MKIVIDVPEKVYNRFCQCYRFPDEVEEAILAITEGTPLPKGCGRLGDLDKIQSMARKKAEDCFPEGRYDYGYRKALFDFVKDIDDAPTIIEADK